ncbi:MAG: site-specific integrase [Longicatena sp.]
MTKSRKDHKGRKLRDGESWRKDGRYSYRYTDIKTGKRRTIYAQDLPELREKENQIARDVEDNILTDGAIKKMTLNALFNRYMESCELSERTRIDYISTWNNRVENEIGNIIVVQLLPSHVKEFYVKLSKARYAHSTIKFIHSLVFNSLEMAVDDDIIRKNPAKGSKSSKGSKGFISDYGKQPVERFALSRLQQENFMLFVKNHANFNVYYPMLTIMLQTGLRCGELIGLTWSNIDLSTNTLNVGHQLIYKNLGDGCRFHLTKPKTKAGVRSIPMTQDVLVAFQEQLTINTMLDIDVDYEVDGLSGFVFIAKTGRPLMPNAINSVLNNIVEAYNKAEMTNAKKEYREVELFPKISAHIMRHTACTRFAEVGMDIKVMQYVMGHAHFAVSMKVYNHVTDKERVVNEIAKLDKVSKDTDIQENKNWCQNGVKYKEFENLSIKRIANC